MIRVRHADVTTNEATLKVGVCAYDNADGRAYIHGRLGLDGYTGIEVQRIEDVAPRQGDWEVGMVLIYTSEDK
jgi:hypothetical protein